MQEAQQAADDEIMNRSRIEKYLEKAKSGDDIVAKIEINTSVEK